jgi:DNA-3-methyladenine glycosylase
MGRADALKPSGDKARHPPLPRAELPVDTVSLARYLIGKILVREMAEGVASGRIVETEAYVVGDAAGHAYRGMTTRNQSLFLDRGHAYVYLAYGSSYMLNVSSETLGVGAGVLIRALEPRDGIAIMQQNRASSSCATWREDPAASPRRCGLIVGWMGSIFAERDLIWLGRDDHEPDEIGQSIRIGIAREANRLLRFYVRGSPFVSGPKLLKE